MDDDGQAVWGAVAAVTSGVDGLATEDLWRVDDDDLLDVMRVVEIQARRLFAASLRLVAEVDDRGISGGRGASSTAALVRQVMRIGPGDAAARVAAADAVVDRVGPSAEPVPAALPATAAATREGNVDAAQLRVILGVLRRLPATADAGTRAHVEKFLAEQAVEFDAKPLGVIGRRLVATLDPDGTLADDEAAVAARELSFHRDADGMIVLRGRLDPEGGAVLRTALDPFAGPRPAGDDEPDPRSPSRRSADALIELARRALTSGELPTNGGQRPQVVVTVDLPTLQKQIEASRPGLLDWGGPVTADTVRRIACDAQIIPVVLSGAGVPLDVGRATPTVPAGIRRALLVRDRGCAFPGCDRPPTWCDAHHMTHWADNGPTSVANLVLLCGHHHRTVHHKGWQVRLAEGHPEFIPPPWVDPTRTPRRNRLHDLPEFPRAG